MPDTTVQLGDFVFADYEVPSSIPWGGDQALSVKKLLGGVRVVDALGPDDMDLSWSGRFQGANASDRALQLDQMRKAGLPLTLTWGGMSYTVVIHAFRADYQRAYQQPYSITCVVVADNTIAPAPSESTLDDLVSADMGDAAADAATIEDPTVAPAVGALQSAIAAVGTLQGASATALAPVLTAAQTALNVIAVSLTDLDGATYTDAGSVAGVAAGGFPPDLVSGLTAQTALISQQATLRHVNALVSRVATNIAQATG